MQAKRWIVWIMLVAGAGLLGACSSAPAGNSGAPPPTQVPGTVGGQTSAPLTPTESAPATIAVVPTVTPMPAFVPPSVVPATPATGLDTNPQPPPATAVPAAPTLAPRNNATVPTLAPNPSTGTTPNVRRIAFAPGTDSAVVQSTIPPGGMDRWILGAQAGQTMSVQLSFSAGSGVLIVYGADGNVLQSDHAGASTFNGTLPSTQDYYLDVRGDPNVQTNYALTVTIPPLSGSIPPPSNGMRKRIQFSYGSDSATVAGATDASGHDYWVLRAQASQRMSVQASFASGQGVLVIWGADGTVLLSDHAGATQFNGQLPFSEDYNIDVSTPGGPTNYTLTVAIPP